MRPPVQLPGGAVPVVARGPPPLAPKPLSDEGGPQSPLVPKPPAPPPQTLGAQGAEQGGAAAAGGMMGGGSWGGGISPGSLEGVSTLRMFLYAMGMMVVMFLLFGVYAYAMIDEDDSSNVPPPGDYFPGDGVSCWSYENEQPWSWSQLGCIENNSCGGQQQSPVNIETFHVAQDIAIKPLQFRGHRAPLRDFTVTNDGLMLTLRASPTDKASRTVRGGGLPGTFVFRHAFFHWGSSPGQGSEHRIDGIAYPMEAQFVYTNEKYAVADAPKQEDGLAVIATFYQLTFVEFDSVKALRAMLGPLQPKRLRRRSLRRLLPWMIRRLLGGTRGSNKDEFKLTLDKLMPPAGRGEFFTYRGSLTMPPCTEPIRWIVFKRPAFVSETLVQRLRGLRGHRQGSSLFNNFRPPQKLNGRTIFSSFPPF